MKLGNLVLDGRRLGCIDGDVEMDGCGLGMYVGSVDILGVTVGDIVGKFVGNLVGNFVGNSEGVAVIGESDGFRVGCRVPTGISPTGNGNKNPSSWPSAKNVMNATIPRI